MNPDKNTQNKSILVWWPPNQNRGPVNSANDILGIIKSNNEEIKNDTKAVSNIVGDVVATIKENNKEIKNDAKLVSNAIGDVVAANKANNEEIKNNTKAVSNAIGDVVDTIKEENEGIKDSTKAVSDAIGEVVDTIKANNEEIKNSAMAASDVISDLNNTGVNNAGANEGASTNISNMFDNALKTLNTMQQSMEALDKIIQYRSMRVHKIKRAVKKYVKALLTVDDILRNIDTSKLNANVSETVTSTALVLYDANKAEEALKKATETDKLSSVMSSLDDTSKLIGGITDAISKLTSMPVGFKALLKFKLKVKSIPMLFKDIFNAFTKCMDEVLKNDGPKMLAIFGAPKDVKTDNVAKPSGPGLVKIDQAVTQAVNARIESKNYTAFDVVFKVLDTIKSMVDIFTAIANIDAKKVVKNAKRLVRLLLKGITGLLRWLKNSKLIDSAMESLEVLITCIKDHINKIVEKLNEPEFADVKQATGAIKRILDILKLLGKIVLRAFLLSLLTPILLVTTATFAVFMGTMILFVWLLSITLNILNKQINKINFSLFNINKDIAISIGWFIIIFIAITIASVVISVLGIVALVGISISVVMMNLICIVMNALVLALKVLGKLSTPLTSAATALGSMVIPLLIISGVMLLISLTIFLIMSPVLVIVGTVTLIVRLVRNVIEQWRLLGEEYKKAGDGWFADGLSAIGVVLQIATEISAMGIKFMLKLPLVMMSVMSITKIVDCIRKMAEDLNDIQKIKLDKDKIMESIFTIFDVIFGEIGSRDYQDNQKEVVDSEGNISKMWDKAAALNDSINSVFGAIYYMEAMGTERSFVAKAKRILNQVGKVVEHLGDIGETLVKISEYSNTLISNKESIMGGVEMIFNTVKEVMNKIDESYKPTEGASERAQRREQRRAMRRDKKKAKKMAGILGGVDEVIVEMSSIMDTLDSIKDFKPDDSILTNITGEGGIMSVIGDIITTIADTNLDKADNKKFRKKMDILKDLGEVINNITIKEQGSAEGTKTVIDSYTKFVESVNNIQVDRVKSVKDMFKQMAKVSEQISENFETISETLKESIAPVLKDLKDVMDKNTNVNINSNATTGTTTGTTNTATSNNTPQQPINIDNKEVVGKITDLTSKVDQLITMLRMGQAKINII